MAENNASVNQGSGSGSTGGRGRRNLKGNRSDIGWRYASDYSGDGKKVRCNFCAKVIGGISRFKHHLAGTSEDSEPCTQVSDEVRITMLKIIATLKDDIHGNDDSEDVHQTNEDEGGAGAARADCSTNPPVPHSSDMLFGPNIEDPLSSDEEFDQAERDDIDGENALDLDNDRFSF